MANEGIFITKNGVTLPAVTEMSTTNWAAYQANLVLALIKNTTHTFNVFEGFKYRGDINENVPAEFIFNAKTNYTPQFTLGGGTLNTSNGRITPTTQPLSVKEANKVFLVNSIFRANQLVSGDDVAVRIESIDALSRITYNIDTGALAFFKTNVSTHTDTIAVTEPESVTIEVLDDAITLSSVNIPAEIYSLPRTFTAKVASGAIGTIDSSGTSTGDALPFDQTDALVAANSVTTGTLTIESSFGQLTTYTVKLGDTLEYGGIFGPSSIIPLSFVAGQAGSHAITDDYDGGVGTKKYHIVSGSMPSGLTLTSGGLIQGTATTDGQSDVTVGVADEFGDLLELQYRITVTSTANVDYNPQPGVLNSAYEYNPQLPAITNAEITAGSIPTGLTLDADTGEIAGIPTVAGTYSFTIELTMDEELAPESIDVTIVIYEEATAEVFRNGDSAGLVENSDSLEVNSADGLAVTMSGGSGNFQYSITGENQIDSDGNIELAGDDSTVTITIVDIVTGQQITFTMLIAGQNDICGLAVVEESDTENSSAPCTDVLTDCSTPVTIAFNAMQILKGVDPTDVPYREFPLFDTMENAEVQNNGKAFSMFLSKAVDSYAIASNGKDGKNFILEFAVDASIANSTYDAAIGIAKKFTSGDLTGLEFAVVVTTVSNIRYVEIRKNNVYQGGSRFAILEGQMVGFGVFTDRVILYVDGIAKYSTTSHSFSCNGADIVFFAQRPNMIFGGKANNLVFTISTPGTPDEIGTIDAQTGLYTPALDNVSLVKIVAYSTVNINVHYQATVRVIRGAMKTSLEHAMIEGVSVDMYVADLPRKDELPMRLDREGKPDRNQFTSLIHLGTLAGSAKMDPQSTRNDFRNDRGATSTSLIIDKIVISGAFLATRRLDLVKRLVPYMKESNSHGVRRLQQYSSGCHKRMRIILVWQAPNCEDVTTFDAVEFVNGLSYTLFALEVGAGVQSNLPLSIEGFPDANGVICEYNQFDKHYHRIGSAS